MGKQALGKNCFSFPEIGGVGTGWEEVVMNLWRQQYLSLPQPERRQVETRWQIHHDTGHLPVEGHILGWGVPMPGVNTPVVRNGGQPFLSSYCVLSPCSCGT